MGTAWLKRAKSPKSHSALTNQDSALITQHSGTQHSALSTQHSALSTQHSALSTQHSALSTQHSALSTQHSALSLMYTNPYLNRVAIRDPRQFFGRKREVAKIFSRIGASRPQSIAVVG